MAKQTDTFHIHYVQIFAIMFFLSPYPHKMVSYGLNVLWSRDPFTRGLFFPYVIKKAILFQVFVITLVLTHDTLFSKL